ncbi:hypothetical protein Chls_461 [Chlamydia suis]|uniref:Uncharacterized protein n=1 Tax=Chlamydia suis TaxID=83559 RepID=A0ABX6IT85_9CHLA|nr:hypothetical protein Chls_461 [Chlamydia suis]
MGGGGGTVIRMAPVVVVSTNMTMRVGRTMDTQTKSFLFFL